MKHTRLFCEQPDNLAVGDRIKPTSGDSTLYYKLVKKTDII